MHAEEIVLRKALPAEATLLTAIAMRSKAYWGYPTEFMSACRDELTVSLEKMTQGRFHCVVAEHRDAILGFYTLERLSSTRYELEALFIEPSYIGQGLGRRLIEHARGYLTSLHVKELVIQGDPNAEGFYRAVGGVADGVRESGSIPGRYLPVFRIPL